MFFVNHVPFKEDVHRLIDETMEKISTDPKFTSLDDFRSRIAELAKEHRIPITASGFANHLAKLIMANNAHRAHKLVDALGDSGLSIGGAVTIAILKVVFKYGMLALFILAILWAYNNCGG